MTAEEINKLPDNVRKYIHDVETLCDPAGYVQQVHCLKMQVDALTKERARKTPRKQRRDITWYVTALRKLSPLRYHMAEIMQEVDSAERFNRSMGMSRIIPIKKVQKAKRAMKSAEKFFTHKKI